MEKMKSLADKLREAVNQSVPVKPDKTTIATESQGSLSKAKTAKPGKEVKQSNKSTKLQKKSNYNNSDISKRINGLSFDGETKEPRQVPIRFPASLYSRLRLLGEEASIQKTTVYAVYQLIESDEVKAKLKNILKNFNE